MSVSVSECDLPACPQPPIDLTPPSARAAPAATPLAFPLVSSNRREEVRWLSSLLNVASIPQPESTSIANSTAT